MAHISSVYLKSYKTEINWGQFIFSFCLVCFLHCSSRKIKPLMPLRFSRKLYSQLGNFERDHDAWSSLIIPPPSPIQLCKGADRSDCCKILIGGIRLWKTTVHERDRSDTEQQTRTTPRAIFVRQRDRTSSIDPNYLPLSHDGRRW